jgi:IMP dehydrogenase
MHRHRLERVLVINGDWELRGPHDGEGHPQVLGAPQRLQGRIGRLRVGAAVGVGEGTEERVAALVEAGADVIVVDTAHGHAQGVLDRVKWVKKTFPSAGVGGNIATRDAAKALVDHGPTA